MHSWPLLLPTFALLSSFLSFFLFLSPSFAFDPLQGISRGWKFVTPNILEKLEDICKKNLGDFYIFSRKKNDFLGFLLLFKASIWSRPPGPPAAPGVFIIHFNQNPKVFWLLHWTMIILFTRYLLIWYIVNEKINHILKSLCKSMFKNVPDWLHVNLTLKFVVMIILCIP